MGVYLLNISRQPEKPKSHNTLDSGLMSTWLRTLRDFLGVPADVATRYRPDPRMSMSGGRLSTDMNGPYWSQGGASGYAPDGSLLSAGHGRRSSIYRAQNSTLFNAFEEESVGLTELPEEEESDDEGRRGGLAPRGGPVNGSRIATIHGDERSSVSGARELGVTVRDHREGVGISFTA